MEKLTLFNMGDLEKRKTAKEEEFVQSNIDLLTAFPDIVSRSFERLNKEFFSKVEIQSRDKNMAATLMSGFLKGELLDLFPHYCGVATKKRFKIKGPNGEHIYIKKLIGKKPRPKNIETNINTKIYNQLSDSKLDVGSNIFLGYTANKCMTQETGTYAICIDGEEEIWRTDLSTLIKSTVVSSQQNNKETKLKEGIVKLKKKLG